MSGSKPYKDIPTAELIITHVLNARRQLTETLVCPQPIKVSKAIILSSFLTNRIRLTTCLNKCIISLGKISYFCELQARNVRSAFTILVTFD